jgi:hypothetical protein
MKNVAFWDIKPQFVLHRRHITSPLQSTASYYYVRFEVFTAVTMKNVVFWDIKTPFIPHTKHVVSTTVSSQLTLCIVRSEVFTAVAMKNAVFWDVALCGPC